MTGGIEPPWQPMEDVPADEQVIIRVGAMTFHAIRTADGWQAAFEGEHPAAWIAGRCPDEDERPALQPWGWRYADDGYAR